MATAELTSQIRDTQARVDAVFDKEEKAECRLPGWVNHLKSIAGVPEDVTKNRLGESGKRLRRFASRVNLEHPDLEVFVDSLPKCAVDMFKFSAEALNKEGGYEEGEFGKWGDDGKTVLRSIQQPRTRLLLSEGERFDQRAVKKHPKSIGLKGLFNAGGENAYFGRPVNFNRFARGSDVGYLEMAELDKKHARFKTIQMHDLAESFAKRMRTLQDALADYFGFYRIKPDEASITLARMHGFKWSESGSVIVPAKFFGDFQFWTEKAVLFGNSVDAKMEAIKKTLILNTKFSPTGSTVANFAYQSRMYPLPQFVTPPDGVKRIIEKVEKFSALGGNPFFDYLWVLVPSVWLNHPLIKPDKEVDKWHLSNGEGTASFDDPIAAATYLDTKLVERKLVCPIVIGERDGKCYFLSMWWD